MRLLPDYGMAPIPMHAVYTSQQYMASKLRSFIDFLAERLGSSEKGSQRLRHKREQLSSR